MTNTEADGLSLFIKKCASLLKKNRQNQDGF